MLSSFTVTFFYCFSTKHSFTFKQKIVPKTKGTFKTLEKVSQKPVATLDITQTFSYIFQCLYKYFKQALKKIMFRNDMQVHKF